MRIVDPSVTAGMQETREIAGRLTLRDTRLRFTALDAPEDAALMNGYTVHTHDADNYNGGIMRLAARYEPLVNAFGWVLYPLFVPDPTAVSWPVWGADAGIAYRYHRPALFQNWIFNRHPDGGLDRREILVQVDNSLVLGASTIYTGILFDATYGYLNIAPVSSDISYVTYYPGSGAPAKIVRIDLAANTHTEWPGQIYSDGKLIKGFDAESIGDTDYIFYTNNQGEVRFTKYSNGIWSDSQPLIPMDVFDETSSFQLGGVSKINDRLVVSGILKRPSGIAMHVYFTGTDHFTMGRDLFVTEQNVANRTSDYVDFNAKLLLHGDNLYYLGMGDRLVALANRDFGVDPAGRKLATSNFTSARIASQSKAPAQLSAVLGSGLALPDGTEIGPGMEVEIEAAYNGSYAKLGTFEIDSVAETEDPTGRGHNLMARSKAMKRLAQWQSDSDFDYWSQAKLVTSSINDGKLVRSAGHWTQAGEYFINDRVADEGILYGTARASHGQSVKAWFYHPDTAFTWLPEFGVILNYYRENRAEAAERLGKEAADVEEKEFGHNGIYILATNSYIAIYSVVNSVRTMLDYEYWNPTSGTWYQFWGILQDGRLRFYTRQEGSTAHTLLLDYVLPETAYRPPENRGRGAIYIQNGAHSTTTPGFGSASPVVPVDDISVFPDATGHIQVDNEIIYYDSRKTVTDTNDKALREMTLFPEGCEVEGATFFNPYWPVNTYVDMDGKTQLWLEPAGATYDKTTYSGFALACTEGTNKGDAYKIYWYDYQAPAQWRPTKTYPLPDTWQDHVGESGAGVWYGPAIRRIVVWGFPPPGDSDTRYVLYDTLTCGSDYTVPDPVGRGEMGTTPSSHAPGAKVYRYTTNRIRCKDVEIVSTDLDISLREMVTELARKAGVLNVRTEVEVESPLATGDTTGGFHFFEPRTRYGSSIVRIKIPATGQVGVRIGGAVAGVPIVGITAADVYRYAYNPGSLNQVPTEAVPLPSNAAGSWATFSADEGVISVWVNDRLVASFADTHATYLQEVALAVYANTSIEVDWPVLDTRVDNFILDMGKRGTQLLERLIGEKRVFYQDDADGALHCFRRRKAVNAGSPYPLSVADGRTHTDAELVTRVRLDGAEAYEAVDWDQLREYGNLFGLFNMRELLLMAEFQQEAADILDDAAGNAHRTTLAGAADPRVEPEDILSVTLPDGTKDVIVRGVSFNLMQGEREALFDMEIEARDV